MKNILVTGGAGFIGTNLIKTLIKDNNYITSIDNYSTGLKENEIEGVKYINSDIELINQLESKFMFSSCRSVKSSTII